MKVWHVTVKEAGAPEGRSRRFIFSDPNEAWDCYSKALAAGFDVRGVKVERHRELVRV
jgi:hypothetical protein